MQSTFWLSYAIKQTSYDYKYPTGCKYTQSKFSELAQNSQIHVSKY